MKSVQHAQQLAVFSDYLEKVRPTVWRASLELNLFLSDSPEGRLWNFLQSFTAYQEALYKFSANDDEDNRKALIGRFHSLSYAINSLQERS